MKPTIAVFYGGKSEESEISKISAEYIFSQINRELYNPIKIYLNEKNVFLYGDRPLEIIDRGFLLEEKFQTIDLAIPWFHGSPGETGEIQSIFNHFNIPYTGSNTESMGICWNKITSKLWFENLSIPNLPFLFLSKNGPKRIEEVTHFFQEHKKLFIKSASQGSSIGCHFVDNEKNIQEAIKEAFLYSEYVLVEKYIKAKEIEFSAYQFDGEIKVEGPGEIITPEDEFYTYDEKYGENSSSKLNLEVNYLEPAFVSKLKKTVKDVFLALNLKDYSRFDFFYESEENYYLNEINTIPGCTPISMFPKLIDEKGPGFKAFLNQLIKSYLKR